MKCMGFVLVLSIAAAQATSAQGADRDEQERAVAAIRKLGAKVEVDSTKPGKPVIKVSFRNTPVTDEGLAHLKVLTDLQELDLSHTTTTNAGLQHIGGLTQLTKLNLSFVPVSDGGLVLLKGLAKLKWIDLERSCKDPDHFIGDAGLKHLTGLTELEYLNLDWNKITDAGLQQLKGLSNLKEVIVASGKVTDNGVKELQKALPKAKIKLTTDIITPR